MENTPVTTKITNAVGTPSESLQNFDLRDLQQYTREQSYATDASKDFHLFYVGRDDVHSILKHVLSRVSVSLYLNMFGYDDSELNDILMAKVMDPDITVLITLDKSQSGGVTEKKLIAADEAHNLAAFNSHFVIGESATHQISHTKGFVADGKVAAEGSTNWSTSGEGAAVHGALSGTGYKAQNNTQSIITDEDTISRFTAELIAEHLAAQKQSAGTTDNTIKTNKAAAPVVPKSAKDEQKIADAKATVTKKFVAEAAAHKTATKKTTSKKAAAKKN